MRLTTLGFVAAAAAGCSATEAAPNDPPIDKQITALAPAKLAPSAQLDKAMEAFQLAQKMDGVTKVDSTITVK